MADDRSKTDSAGQDSAVCPSSAPARLGLKELPPKGDVKRWAVRLYWHDSNGRERERRARIEASSLEEALRKRSAMLDELRPRVDQAELRRKFIIDRSVPEPNSGCWLWESTIDEGGYGRTGAHGHLRRAHRYSFEAFRHEIQEGLYVLHKCDNRGCVNPDHLEVGTAADNFRHMRERGGWDAAVARRMRERRFAVYLERMVERKAREAARNKR